MESFLERERRRCGLLLPIFSLPGPHGTGELGPAALHWLDFLAEGGQGLWQVLPLNPTGHGNSPYQSPSALASDPFLIGLESLKEDGLLEKKDFIGLPGLPGSRIDHSAIRPLRTALLRKAVSRFLAYGIGPDYENFCVKERDWLEDYALFSVLGDRFATADWTRWPTSYRDRKRSALERAQEEWAAELSTYRVEQYLFQRQWDQIRRRAARLDISLVGDMPIFVSHDSVDVWSRRKLFDLDEAGLPRTVAGVPPDYFSATGQRWGNPLYRWEQHREEGYGWWASRFRRALSLFDAVRVDHFRAFADYWEIPAMEPTAVRGRWVEGPGEEFFRTMEHALGPLPIIAEDLGILSERAVALRDRLDLPGLRILLFALDDYHENSPFLPENFVENCIAYTGTHDNDTAAGALLGTEEGATRRRNLLLKILPQRYGHLHLIDGAMAWLAESRARWLILPIQDILHLGSYARMNIPGTTEGNWTWRLMEKDLELVDRDLLRRLGAR
ncbi:MAG: 4-alpha-glucanotransferase [Puniceicoccales bacterium]|jgi:4-alpha-glucanotransferase|nr:4-alpha-glucanotransferase [Puniceicoccales bacterium]